MVQSDVPFLEEGLELFSSGGVSSLGGSGGGGGGCKIKNKTPPQSH